MYKYLLSVLLLPMLLNAAPMHSPVSRKPSAKCSDLIDNNANTVTDWPIDPACVSGLDNTESTVNLTAKPVIAYSWSPVDAGLTYTQYAFQMTSAAYNDLPNVRAQLLAMPVGRRAIMDFDMTQISGYTPVTDDPEDYCTNVQNGSKFKCIFWDHGVEKRKPRYEALFKYLKTSNTPLDYFIGDFEPGFSNWAICNGTDPVLNQPMFDSFSADSRFQPIRAALTASGMSATDPLGSICDWRNSNNYNYWNTVMRTHTNNYLTKLIVEPLQKYYPQVNVSNYDYHNIYPSYLMTDHNGHLVFLAGYGGVNGNEQSVVLYGQALGPGFPFARTTFNSLRFDINQVFNTRKSSSIYPVSAWIANYDWNGSLYHLSPLYDEMVFHSLAAGITHFYYWNLAAANSTALDNLIKEFNLLAGYADRTSDLPSVLNWTDDYILTCTEVGVRRVCRFTPETTATYTSTSVGLEVQTPTKLLRFSKAVKYKPSSGSLGAWIIQPKQEADVLPISATPVPTPDGGDFP